MKSLTRLHRSGWHQNKVRDLVAAGYIVYRALSPTTAFAVGADQRYWSSRRSRHNRAAATLTIPPSGSTPPILLLSLIIGTSKSAGIGVYDLAGNERQVLDNSGMNNVDLRYNFPLGGASVDLVTAGNRTSITIGIYRVDVPTPMIVNVAARSIKPRHFHLRLLHVPQSVHRQISLFR